MADNRRQFLASTASAAAATAAMVHTSPIARAADGSKLKAVVLGVGWYGMVDAKAALKVGGVDIAGICDVDSEHLEQSAAELNKLQGHRPQTFADHNEMLDKVDPDIAIIGTPPHWHSLQLIDCLNRGIDVYCEKPLTYDVREGQALVKAVNDSGRVVQVGFQRRQSQAFAEVKQFVESGKAGRIVQADVQIHYKAGTKDAAPQNPPSSLDWDRWCGPAPKIAYSPQVGHKSWRLEKTTGHGHLVDWGIHNIDATRMMMNLDLPTRITADGGIYQYDGIITTPDTLSVHFEFDSMPVVWRHRLWGATEADPQYKNGVFLFGEDATIFTSDRQWMLIPKNNKGDIEVHDAPVDLGGKHMANFLAAVRGQESLACPIEQGFRSTATVQLGMVAYESGTTVHFDPKTLNVKGNDDAAALLRREYRAPYQHPYQA
ncbi:Gfo/Idh/MocA family protein [Crateriforma conspicua]|uniref:Inositol 2-dehydrogenase n=1 Tax=Crateriforma conspicua TaxID=2527996 RepID=A0A5C5Y4H7_9PLAN|nr:Gfo/Idh/MocA family oxidoreductase [Crateriforma conspicua]QDV64148.1 Inositol 2-dehydrogenase [Crateriforma conspicua]TWT69541.1 Inositol 2-dehydrogenase [Crateriforma conspicua]